MDKSKLYYIVTKGTNDRVLTTDKHPLIVESNAVDHEVKKWHSHGEKITIADFEKKFEIDIGGKSGKD